MGEKKKKGFIDIVFGSNNMTLLVIWIIVMVVFSVMNANYHTLQNATNIFYAATTVGLMALGETFLIIAGHMDLSISALAAMSGVIVALFIQAGLSWPIALLITLVIGAVVGMINSALANVFKIQPFIATLAVSQICEGIGYLLSDGRPIPIRDKSFINIGTYKIGGILPVPVLFLFLFFILCGIVLKKTTFGRKIYIIGGNKEAAHLAGINPKKISTVLYIFSSLIGALAGGILAARMHTGQPTACAGADLDAITAAILGGVALSGGKGDILGCFFGLMIIQCFNTGLSVIGVSSFWQSVAKGLLLIAALILDYFRMKKMDN